MRDLRRRDPRRVAAMVRALADGGGVDADVDRAVPEVPTWWGCEARVARGLRSAESGQRPTGAWSAAAAGARLSDSAVGGVCAGRVQSGTAADHVDHLLRDRGAARRHVLLGAGQRLASAISVDAALGALLRARDYAVPLAVGVPAEGIVQFGAGTIGTVLRCGSDLALGIGGATASVDLARVSECHVVRPTRGAALLEFYGLDGRCALIATYEGRDFVQRARWDHVLDHAAL